MTARRASSCALRCCTRTSGSGAAPGRSSSGSCRSGSSITPPIRSAISLFWWCWSSCSGPPHLEPSPARSNDSGARRLRLSRGRALHRHLRRPGRGPADAEDYFLAGRSLGPVVFLLSLFGTNMTAFSILGASGHAFANGIVTYGLMASSSALVIPLGALRDRHAALGARQAPRLHDAGADVPRPLGVRPHRHGHLRRPGRAAHPLHRHRRDGRRHDARAVSDGAGSLLARRRHRRRWWS